MNATKTLTLAALRSRWIGRKIYSSTDPQLDGHPPTRAVEDIHQAVEDGKYYAWSGEHHRANTLESLDRRLRHLAGKKE